MRQIMDAMQEMLRNHNTVLDVGVGTGRFACALNERGFNVVGADISVPMMIKAKEKGLTNGVRSDAQKLPFQDRAFDSVLMVHLLHLVDYWASVVREVGRVARLSVMSLVGSSSGFRIRQGYLKLRKEMGYPLRRFNEAEEGLRKLLTPAETRFVGEFSSEVKADAAIASLEKGDFAINWDLPKDIHRRIIEKLRSEYGGKDEIVVFKTGGETSFTIYKLKPGEKKATGETPSSYPIFYAVDAKKAHQQLKDRGVKVGPIQEDEGSQWFSFWDLDQNLLEVCHW